MPQEQAVQILSMGLSLGIGVIIGAIGTGIAFSIFLSVTVKCINLKNSIDDYRELREERRESAAAKERDEPLSK